MGQTILNLLKFLRRKLTREKLAIRSKLSLLLLSLSKLRLELSLLRDQSRSFRRRLTDLKMNLFISKKSTSLLPKNLNRHLLRCLDIKNEISYTCSKESHQLHIMLTIIYFIQNAF